MNTDAIAAFDLLSRMRFACGDNGKRMQGELEAYLRSLRQDAERYRTLRKIILADPCAPMTTAERVVYRLTRIDGAKPGTWDAAIDAAMQGANADYPER